MPQRGEKQKRQGWGQWLGAKIKSGARSVYNFGAKHKGKLALLAGSLLASKYGHPEWAKYFGTQAGIPPPFFAAGGTAPASGAAPDLRPPPQYRTSNLAPSRFNPLGRPR